MAKNKSEIQLPELPAFELLNDNEISQTRVEYGYLLLLQINRIMISAASNDAGGFITAVNMLEALIPEHLEDDNYKKKIEAEKKSLKTSTGHINEEDTRKLVKSELEFHRIKLMLLMQMLHNRGMLKR